MPDATGVPPVVEEKTDSMSDTRIKLRNLAEKLRKAEAKELSGAASSMSKTSMLDVSVIEKMHPEFHYRHVNMTDPQKVQFRKDRGYVPVSDEEGKEAGIAVRHGNELVLMKCAREVYDKKVEQQRAMNKARLVAHKAEVQGVAEGIVRQLKEQYGIDVPLNRLMVSE